MKDFVVICDTHFKISSNVRDNLLDDLVTKLEFVVSYANSHDAQILHAGDVFDKPSVPDAVKNRLAPILLKAKYRPICIYGNHDELYSSEEYMYKTSYQVWASHGIIRPIDKTTVDLGDVIVTNELPVIQRGKPQIVLFHGFLNIDDGKNTFRFQDVSAGVKDNVYICLGHDHCVYDPLQLYNNIKIFRPGSFNRQTRDEESMRTPQILHIKVDGDKLKYKFVEIAVARPYDEVFNVKLKTVTKSQQKSTYEELISQIRSANVGDLTFEQALKQVADEEICVFANKVLTDFRLNNQYNKQNL